MMKRYITTLVIMLCVVLAGYSQPRQLTFDECVSMALDENVRIRSARNNIIGAGYGKKEAFTGYLPTVSLSGTGMVANDHLIEMQMQFPPQLPIPDQSIELAKSGVAANITAMLPIYAGGRIYNGNRLAQLGVDVERLRMMQSENEVRTTVAQYYWQIVLLSDKIKTVAAIQLQLEVMYGDAEAAYNAGVATYNDVLQVDLKKNEMESIALELSNGVEVIKMMLAQFIGVEDYTSFDIPGFPSDTMLPNPKGLLVVPENVLPITAEYQLLNKQIEVARLQKRITLGESLPSVAVGGGYFFNNFLDRSRSSWIGMLTVSIPISWKTGYGMRRNQIAIDNAIMAFDDGRERLAIAMHKSFNDLDVAYRNIAIARKSIEQARENLRMHEDFYQAGTATMSDLLDAQTLYRQSCDRYSEAVATYQIRKVEYLVLTGR